MASRNRVVGVDLCIADIVAALNAGNLDTLSSCCGHSKCPGSIGLADGRWLLICTQEHWDKLIPNLKNHVKDDILEGK